MVMSPHPIGVKNLRKPHHKLASYSPTTIHIINVLCATGSTYRKNIFLSDISIIQTNIQTPPTVYNSMVNLAIGCKS